MARKSKYEWLHNCWTGNHTAWVTDKVRLIRIGHATPCPDSGITFLYSAEEGRTRGPWERTPAKALASLKNEMASGVVNA